MNQLLLIAVCGAIGAVSRYAVSGWTHRILGERFPFGTLAVNLLGCFLLGAVAHIGTNSELIRPSVRQAVSIGMLGAFTTFSTFGYETLMHLQSGQWKAGLTNVAVNVLFGLACVWIGMQAGRAVIGGV